MRRKHWAEKVTHLTALGEYSLCSWSDDQYQRRVTREPPISSVTCLECAYEITHRWESNYSILSTCSVRVRKRR